MRYGGFIEENFRAGLSWQRGGDDDRDEDYFRVAFVGKSFVLGAHGAVRRWGRGGGATAMGKTRPYKKGR